MLLKFLKNLSFFDSYFWSFNKSGEKIKVIFLISAIIPSIWNVFIKFRWHDEKLTPCDDAWIQFTNIGAYWSQILSTIDFNFLTLYDFKLKPYGAAVISKTGRIACSLVEYFWKRKRLQHQWWWHWSYHSKTYVDRISKNFSTLIKPRLR